MAKCTSCSAPLPERSITCEYCGSRNDVDLQGVHYFTTHETDQERICPRCSAPLKTINLHARESFFIERCDECLGLFFDPGELEALLEATVSNVFQINNRELDRINRERPQGYGISYIKCPVCTNLMNRVNFGTRSGVVIDRCREHGIWLDGGELRHLLEWMKAGGKLLHQERQEQMKKLEADERAREARLQELEEKYNPESSSFDFFGGTISNQDPDLFRILGRVIRIFM